MNIAGYSVVLNFCVFGFGVYTDYMLTSNRPNLALFGLVVGSAVSISISLLTVMAGRSEVKALLRKLAAGLHLCAALMLFNSVRTAAYPELFRTTHILVGIFLVVCAIVLLLMPAPSEPSEAGEPALAEETPPEPAS